MSQQSRLRTTDLHDWEYPDTGYDSDEEAVPYGDLFVSLIETHLDEGIPVIDTEAAMGNYPPKAGARFLATDTGNRYLGDGSQWQEWPYAGSGSGDAPPASTYESGGSQELNVTGLQGDLADPQDPKPHAHDGDALGSTTPLESVTSEALLVKQSVDADETLTVPSDYAAVVVGEYTVNGTVAIDGTFIVL